MHREDLDMTAPTISRRRRYAAATLAIATLAGGAATACDPATATTTGIAVGAHSGHDTASRSTKVSAKTQKLATTMRGLWDDHMAWTWAAVIGFATNSPAESVTIDRLVQNQRDMGAALGSIYGSKVGDAVTGLLTTHITDAVPVLQAAKAGDQAALDVALDAWYANAREIADALAGVNPRNWKRGPMREMMKTHISQTVAYAAAAISGDYAKAVSLYDEAHAHMAEMADMLSAGIVKQFPKKF